MDNTSPIREFSLLQLIKSRPKNFYFYLVIFSVISSITNVGILMLVNTAFAPGQQGVFGNYASVGFGLLFVISFLCTLFFQNNMTVFTNNLVFDLELSIVKKVRAATFESFNELGRERIYSVIADTRMLGEVPERFITLINSVISIFCALVYLFWISPVGAAVVLLVMLALLLIYLYRNKRILTDIEKMREYQNKYYFYLTEMLMGFKQVNISGSRNAELFNEYILKHRGHMNALGIKSSKKFIANQISGTYSWYLMLGLVVFALPMVYKADVGQTAAFITIILFIISPITAIISMMSYYSAAKVAVERLNQLDQALVKNDAFNPDIIRSTGNFSSIRFENVTYKYNNDNGASFMLDLPDFSIDSHEVLFIIGGNGSGKTTFINILTGLYQVQTGNIYVDGRPVSYKEFRDFSNNMAVVFNDQYLFKENYDRLDLSEKNEHLFSLIRLFNMQDVLKIDGDRNFFDTRLSKGQQKRLSLLLALLEDKPILVLDEWAAEQDPDNRTQFYTEWLKVIRDMGKTIIVISHDDDYFYAADRVVKFNYGKISSDKRHTAAQTV